MIWADKIGLGIAVAIAAFAVGSCIVLFIGIGTFDDVRLDLTVALWAAIGEFVIALPSWAVLRGLDALAGGPRRRANRRDAQSHAPANLLAGQDLSR